MSLRTRLLLLVLVAAAPTLVVAAALERLMAARFEAAARQRLAAAHAALEAHLRRLQARAAAQVGALAREDLPQQPRDPDLLPSLAAGLAQRRDLPVLEILDESGRVLSSAHWPVGMGLADRDQPFAGPLGLRLERVGDEYGLGQRLALTAEQQATWQGAPVLVRGGQFLDEALLAELAGLTQTELAVQAGDQALVPSRSPLPVAAAPGGAGAWRLERRELGAGLTLVAAVPRREADALVAEVRQATLAAAALALAAGVLVALVLARRLERPVSALAEGARRRSAGALGSRVPEGGPPEVRDLARAMNAMSAALEASQSRLVQAERVASWREMARRLAHELKNPIFPIQLSVETLRRTLDRRPATARPAGGESAAFEALFRESSETILQELRSLRRIIDEFSDFARLPQPSLAPTDVNEVVADVLGLYRARAGEVTVETALAPGLPPVPADAELLSRALGNLVANALEAMPQGGLLRVGTELRADGLALTVADTGPGLDDDQRQRLFTPYYTTKPGGTGLGLAIVQSIVSDHGGRLDVASERGRGTTFTLLLPRPA